MEEIRNKVKESGLLNLDLAIFKPNISTIAGFDIADLLWQGLVLKEKDFRQTLIAHQIKSPKMYLGDIASGDLFVSGSQRKANINRNLPSVLCVEMEGAAVAQVCFDFNVPFAVIRTISDVANENPNIDVEEFNYFKNNLAAQYGFFILREYVQLLS